MSLFKEIPKSRSCSQAGITVHWCACLNWQPLSTTRDDVLQATSAAIDKINSIIEDAKKSFSCHKLTLGNITHAAFYKPTLQELMNEQVIKRYEQMKPDSDTKLSLQEYEPRHKIILYQVSFTTRPSGGHFEVTCIHDVTDGRWTVVEKDISRINKYGDAPRCVARSKPHLRPYCYCNHQIYTYVILFVGVSIGLLIFPWQILRRTKIIAPAWKGFSLSRSAFPFNLRG